MITTVTYIIPKIQGYMFKTRHISHFILFVILNRINDIYLRSNIFIFGKI